MRKISDLESVLESLVKVRPNVSWVEIWVENHPRNREVERLSGNVAFKNIGDKYSVKEYLTGFVAGYNASVSEAEKLYLSIMDEELIFDDDLVIQFDIVLDCQDEDYWM